MFVKKFLSVCGIFVVSIYAFFSCNKIETTTIGADLIPAVDNVNTFEEVLDVESDNILLPDSTRMLNNDNHALGILSDPAYGSTNADIYFTIAPPTYGTYPFQKVDSLFSIDSVVLQLAYKGYYGDTMSVQTISVSEIASPSPSFSFSDRDSTGYRINEFQPGGMPLIGSLAPNYNLDYQKLDDDKYWIRKNGDTTFSKSVVRIPLNKSFAQRLASYDTANNYKNDSLFRASFAGIALKVLNTSGVGALSYFNLVDTGTKVQVFYKIKRLGGTGQIDTTSVDFTFRSFANANLVRRNPSSSYLANLNNGNSNDATLYLQATPGSYGRLKIPTLSSLNNRVVHKAELIIEESPLAAATFTNYFSQPNLLFLDAWDSTNGRPITIPNSFVINSTSAVRYDVSQFGGNYNNNKYIFDLTRYVQGIATRKQNSYTLRLYAPFYATAYTNTGFGEAFIDFPLSQFIGAGRVVVNGGSYADPAKKMRLRIIYSKI
ncbi:MAG: DUF4270 family protein [Sphingobacteriales bacterium]|nr:MAG: DUF4270 family protein [Sphingobacteriales bacterium]